MKSLMSPKSYVRNTVRLFPDGTLVLMVTRVDGAWKTYTQGVATGTDALDALAHAQVAHLHNLQLVIRELAAQAGRTQEDVLADYTARTEAAMTASSDVLSLDATVDGG